LYQEFVIEGLEFRKAKHDFLRRVDEYYEMKREPKIENKELLKEFEKKKGGTNE